MYRQKQFQFLRVVAMFAFAGMACINYASGEDSPEFEMGEVLYENPLTSPADVEDWVRECGKEGRPFIISSPENEDMLRLYSDVHHFLLWCPKDFPDNIAVSWDFLPIERVDGKGLAMFWIAATGKDGKDLFHPSLPKRIGRYGKDYRRGAINALHAAYFRRNPVEVNFQTVSLRKTTVQDNGPRVARAGDPIPGVPNAEEPYRMQVIKYGPYFQLSINGMKVLEWKDEGEPLKGGKIGFRQMCGLIADYANLEVRRVERK